MSAADTSPDELTACPSRLVKTSRACSPALAAADPLTTSPT
jgi:hypothetical protein